MQILPLSRPGDLCKKTTGFLLFPVNFFAVNIAVHLNSGVAHDTAIGTYDLNRIFEASSCVQWDPLSNARLSSCCNDEPPRSFTDQPVGGCGIGRLCFDAEDFGDALGWALEAEMDRAVDGKP